MTYAKDSLIQASDYNNLIGASTTTTASTLNATWATGGTSAGYGQTALANVAQDATIGNVAWSNLINTVANAALHQASSITTVSPPAADSTITYLAPLVTNLTTVYNNRLSAAAQGSTLANTVTNTTTNWKNQLLITHTVSFANGDAARYFFNAGGQLAITCTHSNTATAVNQIFSNLASNIGTVVISAMNAGNANIAGTTYNGVTKIGGGGKTPVISQNSGYYAQSTGNLTLFNQEATGSFYSSSFISVTSKSNGTQGSNGDKGSTLYIATIWDEVYSYGTGLTVGTGSTTTLTVRYPSSSVLANTWGTVTLSGVVTSVS